MTIPELNNCPINIDRAACIDGEFWYKCAMAVNWSLDIFTSPIPACSNGAIGPVFRNTGASPAFAFFDEFLSPFARKSIYSWIVIFHDVEKGYSICYYA